MKALKEFLVANFENTFVLIVLLVALILNHFVAYKLAFLNIYFLPVLLAAYYLDLRRSLLGAVACVLITTIYLLVAPSAFDVPNNMFARYMNIFTWSCFLLLTAIIVGDLNGKLRAEIRQTKRLNEDLMASQVGLEQANRRLEDYANNLEEKVVERTNSLEQSKRAIEELKQKVEDALYSTMDPAVVKMIIEKRLRTEKKRVTILFADLKDFTRYSSQRRPEAVITDLNRYLEEMEEVLMSYRGHIDKYIGDAIMAEFGAPIGYDRHCLLAVTSAIKMQQRLARGSYPWQMRIGITTGEPIVGLVGRHKQSYTAIGDTVNMASRIEHLCTPGQVTIGPSTYEEVRRFINCRRKLSVTPSIEADLRIEAKLEEALRDLDGAPDDADKIKKVAYIFLEAKDSVSANGYLRRALELDPSDDRVKVAYAETSLAVSKLEKTSIRGTEGRVTLYEVVGIKNPLLDREKIPQRLYDAYLSQVLAAGEYPEDLILPIECLDGCVGHSRVVGFLSYALADALGLHDQEKTDVLTAGYLADIGKSIVPHHILNRRGSLSRTEMDEVVKHSRESVRILKTMGFQEQPVFSIIESHHENASGTGYPEGLSLDKVPMGAKILAVADAYDAMTSWRPYRDRWEPRSALQELAREAAQGKFEGRILEKLEALLDFKA